MVPTWTGKPGKWEHIFQSWKSQGIVPKIMENWGQFYSKYWKSEGILKLFSDFSSDVYLLNRFLYLLNLLNKMLKNGKTKYWKSQGNLSA